MLCSKFYRRKKYNGIKALLTSARSAHYVIDSIEEENAQNQNFWSHNQELYELLKTSEYKGARKFLWFELLANAANKLNKNEDEVVCYKKSLEVLLSFLGKESDEIQKIIEGFSDNIQKRIKDFSEESEKRTEIISSYKSFIKIAKAKYTLGQLPGAKAVVKNLNELQEKDIEKTKQIVKVTMAYLNDSLKNTNSVVLQFFEVKSYLLDISTCVTNLWKNKFFTNEPWNDEFEKILQNRAIDMIELVSKPDSKNKNTK